MAIFFVLIFSQECDFEEPHLCGYSIQWNHNVNWYMGRGVPNEPSRSDGPGVLEPSETFFKLLKLQFHKLLFSFGSFRTTDQLSMIHSK